VGGGQGADLIDLGAGNDRMAWSPFTGNDTAQGGEGTDTLIIQNYDIAIEDLLAAIQPDPGSPAPFIDENGMISLAGVSGTISIGDSTLTFSGFERMFVNA
jgi:Ca2+-binding RTX toxin-like protein